MGNLIGNTEGGVEWHQGKIREYFNACFGEIYNPFLEMSDGFIKALNDFVNDDLHTGPEAEESKKFVTERQVTLVEDTIYCIQKFQSMMQGTEGFATETPLLENFLDTLSEDDTAVVKTEHLKKIIEDFSGYNTVFKGVAKEVGTIQDEVEELARKCDVVTRKEYTEPDPSYTQRALDDFVTEEKTEGFVPQFKDKFEKFLEDHDDDISKSAFKECLDAIVNNLDEIINGIGQGTFDITRYTTTKNSLKWKDLNDVLKGVNLSEYQNYIKSYNLYLKGLVDRCQVYMYDPVNMSSGNYINDRIDIETGRDNKITFRRFYNAKSDLKGILGNGWSCIGDVRLLEEDGDIKVIYSDGREGLYKEIEKREEKRRVFTPEEIQEEEFPKTYIEIHGEIGRLIRHKDHYRIEKDLGEYEEYDNLGYLTSKGDIKGEHTKITYETKEVKGTEETGKEEKILPVRIENKDKDYIELSYNEDGILTKVETSDGRSVSYGYEVREEGGKREYFLTDVAYPGGSTRRYTYNEQGLIKSVMSPDGIIALINEYDEKRRVIHQTFPDGGEMSYSYDDEKHITTATEQNGVKVEYVSDELGRHVGTRYVGISKDHKSQDICDATSVIEERFTYNERNQKTSVRDKNGHTTRYSYDNRGHLTKIVGPEGLNESYTYDAEGRLLSKKDSEGNIYKYIYDFEGNLYSVTDPEGNRTKYDYEDGKVTCMRDAEGNETLLTYDEKGNISSITDASGITTRYVCDDRGRVEKTIDPEGNETSYTFDENDNLTSVTDPLGNTTRYAYNAAGLLTQMMNPDGSVKTWAYNEIGKPSFYTDENDHTTKIDYNTSWKEESITLPNGGQIDYAYDLLGNMINVTDPEGRKTVYTHDNEGNVLTVGVEDTAQAETVIKSTYTYDKLGRIDTETDAEGNTTTYTYDRNGNLTCKTDAFSGKTTYIYDSLQRVVRITDPVGRETTYTYDKNGKVKTVTDPAGVVTTNHYEKDRLVKVTQKAEDAEEIIIKTYEYDKCGRILAQTERDGFSVSYEYDKAGRPQKISGSNNRVMTYAYDCMGRITQADDCGTKTFYTYTGTGKLSSVKDALGNETRYTYNELDLLSSIERIGEGAEPHVTRFVHDLSGKLISEIDALDQKTIYAYDAAGDIKSFIDRDGNETVYTRDKNGNITGIKYADGKEVFYKYNALNILKEVQDAIGLTKIESDAAGRTILVTDPNGEAIGYEYGPRDEKTAIVYPDGKRAEYVYDAFGRLLELKDVTGDREESIKYSYDENGLLSGRLFPNGTGTSYDYYQGGLLKTLTSTDKDGVLDRYEYIYNEKGNRTQIKRDRRGLEGVSGIYTYSYDELGRLTGTEKDGQKTAIYTYDAFGNRKEEMQGNTKTIYSYDVLDRLISKTEKTKDMNSDLLTTYAYDHRGNLTHEYEGDILKKTYDYNKQGMLERTVLDPEGELRKEISYTYNFVNQRTSKKSGIEEIKYLTDITRDHNNLLRESVNGEVRTFVYDDKVVSFEEGGRRNYYQLDELGSTMYLTGTDGAAYSPYAYDAFGNRIDPRTGKQSKNESQRNAYTRNGNIIQPLAFTGYREEESGNYYAQARSYDPRSGRFTGEDKVRGMIALPDTQNHYLYCLSNPIIMVDTNGLWPTVLIGAIGGAIVGAVSYTVGAVVSGEKIDATQMLASAAGGAAAGALIGSGVVDPTVVGAAAGAASGFVTGTAKAINDVKETVKAGGSAMDVAGAVVNGVGTIAKSTATGGVAGGVMGTVFGKLGAGAAIVGGGVMKGGMALYEELTDDKEGVDIVRVARHTVGGVAETATAILGFKALGGVLSGKETSNTGKKINAQCQKITDYKNTVKTNIKNLTQGIARTASRLLPTMGSSAPGEVTGEMCSGENGSVAGKSDYQNNLEKWGTSSDGINQGERHFNDYWEKYPERIPSLEQRLGVEEGAFANTEEGFNNFTDQAESVIEVATENGTYKSVNGKEIYYVDGAANPKKGVVVIVKDGQLQSMMPSDPKSYGKMQ